jgi:hypothetical protein
VLSGGNLSVAPAGALLAADRGTHGFSVEITSALHTLTLHVSVFVYGATGAITFTSISLPDAILNRPYSAPVQVSGATGAVTFSITGGALPPGLTLDPATGVVSGAAAVLGPTVFTITVVDSTSDTATNQLTLEVKNAPPAKSPAPGGDSGCGVGGPPGHSPAGILALLCALAAVVWTRVTRSPVAPPAAN